MKRNVGCKREKWVLTILLALVLLFGTGCQKEEDKVIKVGASPTPHAEILKEVEKELQDRGYQLEIVEFNDYVQPNLSLDSGDLDVNYFQHQPYLDKFNEEKGTKIVPVVAIHFEPLGLYAGKKNKIADLKKGDRIAVPNDTTNEARALQLLQAQGLIELKDGAGLTASKHDIVKNPLELNIVELDAAIIPRVIGDYEVAVINGNFALGSGLSSETLIVSEDSGSEAAKRYANILAARSGDEKSEKIKVLVEVLRSDKIRQFIETTYQGVVKFVD